MDEWREGILIRIRKLQQQKESIMILDCKVWSQGYSTEIDRIAFGEALTILDAEIERLKCELIIDDLLRVEC